MSIVLKTSTALRACGACVSPDTPAALRVYNACVSQDTPGLRGRVDVGRAQDLDGAASMQRMCVSQDTHGLRGRTDANREDLPGRQHASPVCVADTPGVKGEVAVERTQASGAAGCGACVRRRHTWRMRCSRCRLAQASRAPPACSTCVCHTDTSGIRC
jgi:hypothetical protein